MVLRKPPPPRLENLNKWNAHPASSVSPSKSSPSQRRARLDRAPSEDSIYSPDLNTSPAFDLMPLEEAQRSPVGSPTSHPSSSWTESFGDRPKHEYSSQAECGRQWVPPAPQAGSHATAENTWRDAPLPALPGQNGSMGEVPVQLQSKNPFLKPRPVDMGQRSSDSGDWNDQHSHASATSDPLSQSTIHQPRLTPSPVRAAC